MTPKEKQAKAVEEMNAKAGYDIPVAFATLRTEVINEQKKMGDMPFIESQADITAMIDIIALGHGAVVSPQAVADMCNACVAYGWHYAKCGESMIRSNMVKDEILAFIDGRADMLVEEKATRKEALLRGIGSIVTAIQKATSRVAMKTFGIKQNSDL